MSDPKHDVAVLISELDKTVTISRQNEAYYREFVRSDFKTLGKNNAAAIVFAEIITDYYTCLETLFLRISRFFENNLDKEKWHKDLLHKMTLSIKGVREPVITDEAFTLLQDVLKFRHFKRYYFELSYDWERIDFLRGRYEKLLRGTPKCLADFKEFLETLAKGEKS